MTLSEVLVSLLLLAILLLGIDALQLHAVRNLRTALYISTATHELTSISEQLRALKILQGRAAMIRAWQMELASVLPQGYGTVSGQYPDYVVNIYWGAIAHHCQQTKVGVSGCLRQNISLVSA